MEKEEISHDNWINEIHTNIKIMQTYTMICGILFDISQKREKKSLQISHKDFQELTINNKKIKKKLPKLWKSLIETEFRIFETSITIYKPFVFQEILNLDKNILDLFSSLDLKKNYEKIKKAGEGDGKGGEFFLFTHDNRIILKTISTENLSSFIPFLNEYLLYLKSNPESLLVKIYGIYTFVTSEGGNSKQIHLMVMRNITQCPSKFIERRFDLKGCFLYINF